MNATHQAVRIEVGRAALEGDLDVPRGARAVVAFAHGSGSSRHSPRNRHVAQTLRDHGLGTLLIDLLTPEEELVDVRTTELRFDIGFLARRVVEAVDWLAAQRETRHLRTGLFGASTGAAAAIEAAAARPDRVGAVVSRGGRPDLASPVALQRLQAPTLLIVGGADTPVIGMNEEALIQIPGEAALEIVPGAGHLFEQPGALDQVARLAAEWFARHLGAPEG